MILETQDDTAIKSSLSLTGQMILGLFMSAVFFIF